MRRAPTLMVRELKTFFLSPLAYGLAALYLGITVVFCYGHLDEGLRTTVLRILGNAIFLMALIVPILTMRLLSGEKESGTMEILLTDPVTDWDIVLGKYFAGLISALAVVLPVGLFVLVYWIVGRMQAGSSPLDWRITGSSFLGLFFVLAIYTAVGLLASSLTKNQILSVVLGVIMVIAMWAVAKLQDMLSTHPTMSEFVGALNINDRLIPFVKGQIDTRSIFFFVSFTVLALYLTVRSVESRKWR